MKEDYLPKTIKGLKEWYRNYTIRIKELGNALNLSEDEVINAQKMCEMAMVSIDKVNNMKNELKSIVEHRNKVLKIADAFMRQQARKIKTTNGYTDDSGKLLGIIGSEAEFDAETYRPEVEVAQVSHGVKLEFTKSHTDGVNVYRRKEGEANWTFLARDTRSPYIDTEQIDHHAVLEYMVWAVIDDEEVGKESKIVKITV